MTPGNRSGGSAQNQRAPDFVTIASRLFDVEPSVFMDALGIHAGQPIPRNVRSRVARLRKALLVFRHVIPEEYFSRWAHEELPRLSQSPIDILKGTDGFEEFVHLLEGVVHGDFAWAVRPVANWTWTTPDELAALARRARDWSREAAA